MHRALLKPRDGSSAQNRDARTAHYWAINMYILFKRTKAARDELFMAVSSIRPNGSQQTHRARADSSDAALVLLMAQENQVKILVRELRAKLEEGRHYHNDFQANQHILARLGSPFYHAVSVWGAMERFLCGFEGTSETGQADGRGRDAAIYPPRARDFG